MYRLVDIFDARGVVVLSYPISLERTYSPSDREFELEALRLAIADGYIEAGQRADFNARVRPL